LADESVKIIFPLLVMSLPRECCVWASNKLPWSHRIWFGFHHHHERSVQSKDLSTLLTSPRLNGKQTKPKISSSNQRLCWQSVQQSHTEWVKWLLGNRV